MKFIVSPNKSVGKVEFGLERVEVRRILSGFKKEFKKTLFSRKTTDDFGYAHVFYDAQDKCNALEFWGDVELVYKSKNLFDLNRVELTKLFPDLKEECGSYISVEYSVGITFEGEKIESILFGCKDYYC